MTSLRHLLLAAALALFAQVALAAAPAARIVQLINPVQSTGIRIGDVMERTVVLEAAALYQLSRSALPAKGVQRDGIELADIRIDKSAQGETHRYAVTLKYQVFAHAVAPAVMTLPEEQLALTGGPEGITLKIPAWRFWYAPLNVANIETAKGNLQPSFAPVPLPVAEHRARLYGFLGLLVASALALLWFNADGRWLPFMNGPFAQAYRRVRRLPATDAGWRQALGALHEAFNRVHGRNLFAADIDAFVAAHPRYGSARGAIEGFFAQSGRALFAEAPQDHAAFLQQLKALAKQLRDCERGAA